MKWCRAFVVLAACGGDDRGTIGDAHVEAGAIDAPGPDAPPCTTATLTPAVVDFGTVQVGKTSPAMIATLWNGCVAPIDVDTFVVAGTDASSFAIETNSCVGQLAPGATCTAGVSATPSSGGAKTGILRSGPTVLEAELTVNGAAVAFAPDAHDFGSAPVGGASAVFAFTVSNPTTTSVAITAPVFGGSDPTQFAVIDNACPTSLPAGASCAVTLQLQPTQMGAFAATMTIGGATATMQGKGLGTWVAISPTLQDFGTVGIGHTSTAVTFTVHNTRGLPLPMPTFTLAGADAGSFAIGTTTCTAVLAIDATCTVAVTATPTSAGAKAATLNVMAGQLASATLLATAAFADDIFFVSPSNASFDPGHLTQTFTATNGGGFDLTPTSIAFSGSGAGAFTVASTDCLATIHPGNACTFTIAYAPGAGDALASATFVGATSGSVGLVGSATAPGDLQTGLFVDYGNAAIGTQALRTLTFTNVGTTTTSPLSLAFGGANATSWALITDHCSTTPLPPSASCTVDTAFRPDAAGKLTATLTATAGALTAHANLTGSGYTAGAPPSIAPASHDFGAVGVGGQSSVFTFTYSNDSGVTVLTPAVSLTGTNATQFLITANTCTSDLAPTATCAIGVRFAPNINNTNDTANLRVGTTIAALFGQGVSGPGLVTSTVSINFGAIAIGESGQATFDVKNESTATTGVPMLIRSGANAGDFTASGCTTALAPDTSCTVTVTCTPSASGTRTATLLIAASPGGNANVQLSATGN